MYQNEIYSTKNLSNSTENLCTYQPYSLLVMSQNSNCTKSKQAFSVKKLRNVIINFILKFSRMPGATKKKLSVFIKNALLDGSSCVIWNFCKSLLTFNNSENAFLCQKYIKKNFDVFHLRILSKGMYELTISLEKKTVSLPKTFYFHNIKLNMESFVCIPFRRRNIGYSEPKSMRKYDVYFIICCV